MNKKNNLRTYVILILIAGFIFQACKKDDDIIPDSPKIYERGDITKVSSLGVFSVDQIQQLLNTKGAVIPYSPKYEVEVLSVSYYTCDEKGSLIHVSGAFFIPQTDSDFPLLSIQHGTETKRDMVASVSPNNSTEGIISLLTASIGYVTVAPDYPGLGISNTDHPYLHAESIVPSVVDLMLAGKQYCSTNQVALNGDVFLTGYSEGGYISLLAQKEIEEEYANEFNLTGVSPLSGPYDLKGMFDKIVQDRCYCSPAYVAHVLTSYNNIYEWGCLEDFFQAPYCNTVNGLFDGTKSWSQIVNALPASLDELLNSDFFETYPVPHINHNDLKTTGLVAALKENTMLDWTPEAPLRFFHGDCDNTVFCMNASNAVDAFKANGAHHVELTIIEGGDHETSGPIAISGAIKWFENLRNYDLPVEVVIHSDD